MKWITWLSSKIAIICWWADPCFCWNPIFFFGFIFSGFKSTIYRNFFLQQVRRVLFRFHCTSSIAIIYLFAIILIGTLNSWPWADRWESSRDILSCGYGKKRHFTLLSGGCRLLVFRPLSERWTFTYSSGGITLGGQAAWAPRIAQMQCRSPTRPFASKHLQWLH